MTLGAPCDFASHKEGATEYSVQLPAAEKWRILKNIGVLSFAFMVQFTAFQGIANLQSSINARDGLGTISLSAIYGAIVVSCIFLPTLLIRRLTAKWTLCFSMVCYAPYIGRTPTRRGSAKWPQIRDNPVLSFFFQEPNSFPDPTR